MRNNSIRSRTSTLAVVLHRLLLAACIVGSWPWSNHSAGAAAVPLSVVEVSNGVEISWTSEAILAEPPFLHYEFQLESSTDLMVWTPAAEAIAGGAQDFAALSHSLALPLTNAQVFVRLAYRLNLPGADLSGLDLGGTDLRSANLTNANLSGADLTNADLSGADLSGAVLINATLAGATLTGTDLGNVNLDGLDLTGVDLGQIQGTPQLSQVTANPAGRASELVPSIPYNSDGLDFAREDPDAPPLGVSMKHAMILLKTNITVGELNALLAEEGASIIGSEPEDATISGAMLMVRFPTASVSELLELTERLGTDARVELAVPDVVAGPNAIPYAGRPSVMWIHASCSEIPEVPGFSIWKWDPADDPQGGNWAWEYARVPQMWNLNEALRNTLRGSSYTVVFDGGSPPHQDVVFAEPGGVGPDPNHGLHVAGIIGATYDNRLGIEGINPFVTLLAHSVSKLPRRGTFTTTGWHLVQGTRELIQRFPYARIVTMGYGYRWVLPGGYLDPVIAQAVTAKWGNVFASIASGHGAMLFVTGAGNDYGTVPAHLSSPAAYAGLRLGVSNILVVESHDLSGGLSPFSNSGGNIQAPGERILSAATENQYVEWCGTSMAAAFVSGVAGYLLAIESHLTTDQLKELLLVNGPQVDAFASAMAIDEVRGTSTVLRMLLDLDDGGLDGNERVQVPAGHPGQDRSFHRVVGPDFEDQDIDQNGGPGDRAIDASDFRRWRDWFLYGRNFLRSLNGSSYHLKHDANQDGVVDPSQEIVLHPRGDFNGDGVMDASDLNVLLESGLWDDPIYEDPFELHSLIESVDFSVSIENSLFADGDVDLVKVAPYDLATKGPIDGWATRRVELTEDEPVGVMTVPWSAGRKYYVASDPLEIEEDRMVQLRSIGELELGPTDAGADFAVDLTRVEMTAMVEVENPDLERIDSRPDAEEVAASIAADNGLEKEFPEPTDDLSVPYVGAYAYANDRGVFYTQVRTGWPDPLEGWNSDLESTFTSKVHWQRSFIRVEGPNPTYFVRPIRLRLFGWGLNNREMNAYAEFKLEIRAHDVSPAWRTVSRFVAEIAGRKIDFFENGHSFRVERREAEGGWESPYFFIYEGEDVDIYGVEFIQPAFRGEISLAGIELGHTFDLRYTLDTRAFASIDDYAEAYVGDPFNYGSGVRMEYAGFGELPRVDEFTVDASGAHVGFVALDGFYYILYRGDVPVAVAFTEPGPSELVDPSPPAGADASDYTVDNRPIDQPRDLDSDGIDDVYEMLRDNFLNPLDPSDAALDFDGDGRSNLIEYNQGTDPAVPDDPPVTSDELYPGAIFDPGLLVTIVGDVDDDGVVDLIGALDDELAVALGLAEGGFAPVVSSPYPELRSISDYALADLNADGYPDVVVSDQLDHKVQVMLGDGQGAFAPGDSYPVSAVPVRVTAADVDGDGNQDLITANQSGQSISVLLGKGDGTFQPALETITEFSTPRDVVLANMNGDAHLDLVVAIQQGSQLAIFPGNGDGTFGPRQDFPTAFDPRRIAAGDVNGDGNVDVVTSGTVVSVLLGNGDGTLQERADYTTGEVPLDFALIDLDADGDLDLVVGHSRSEYHAVLLNNGGEFVAQSPAFTAAQGDCLLGDFTRDGRLDLLSRASGGYFITAGLGDGRFDTRLQVIVPDMYATSFDVADVNLDGSIDVLIPNETLDSVEVITGASEGEFAHSGSVPVGPQIVALAAANIDPGNSPDLAVVTERPANNPGDSMNELHVFLGDGSGGFAAQVPMPLPDRPYDLLAGDLTGDGLDDLIVILFFADAAAPFINQGDGTFVAMPLLELGGRPSAYHMVNLNGDTRADFITTVLGRGVVVFTSDENGDLVEVANPLPTGAAANSAAVFDHTGDGIPDLIGFRTSAGSSSLVCHPGGGDGTFGEEQVLVEPYPAGGIGSIEFVDVNADGLADLVHGGLILLRSTGGGFDEPQRYHLSGFATRVLDVNGDQGPDLLSVLNDSLWILLNRGAEE